MLGKPPTPPPPDSPARRFTDAVDSGATLIAAGTLVKGELVSDGSVELAGTLEGDAKIAAHCRVARGGLVQGRLEAKSLLVEGEVHGPALVGDKIEIGATARVVSNIRARVVAMADGAFFQGEVRMDDTGAPATPTTFTEKRGAK